MDLAGSERAQKTQCAGGATVPPCQILWAFHFEGCLLEVVDSSVHGCVGSPFEMFVTRFQALGSEIASASREIENCSRGSRGANHIDIHARIIYPYY